MPLAHCAVWDAILDRVSMGSNKAAKNALTAITTTNPIKVNACVLPPAMPGLLEWVFKMFFIRVSFSTIQQTQQFYERLSTRAHGVQCKR
jgi:hypothetical protein